MGLFNEFRDWMSGGNTSDDYDEAKRLQEEARSKSQQILQDRIRNKKTTAELYNESRGVAGAEAADRSGIAKQQAKAAAQMGGAGKLQSAIAGSAAAQQAVSSGFESGANAAMGAGAQREAQLDALANQSAQNELQSANAQAELQTKKADSMADRRQRTTQNAVNLAAAALSDEKSKNFKKHTYIAKEDR